MPFWANLRSAVRYSTYLFIATVLLLMIYIAPPLYTEYKLDSSLAAARFERFLYPERWNVHALTTYNYINMLRLTEDQNWMRKDLRHVWIYVTGNASCPSPETCERFTTAFDEVIPAYYLNPPANNASIFTLDCDTSPFLCQGWAAVPPALIRIESLGFPHCGIVTSPLLSLQCPFGVRYIPLPTGHFAKALGTSQIIDSVPDEKWQLRSLLESTCAHEVYRIRRLLEHVGNGGQPLGLSGVLGDLVAGYGIAGAYGGLFSWWLGEI